MTDLGAISDSHSAHMQRSIRRAFARCEAEDGTVTQEDFMSMTPHLFPSWKRHDALAMLKASQALVGGRVDHRAFAQFLFAPAAKASKGAAAVPMALKGSVVVSSSPKLSGSTVVSPSPKLSLHRGVNGSSSCISNAPGTSKPVNFGVQHRAASMPRLLVPVPQKLVVVADDGGHFHQGLIPPPPVGDRIEQAQARSTACIEHFRNVAEMASDGVEKALARTTACIEHFRNVSEMAGTLESDNARLRVANESLERQVRDLREQREGFTHDQLASKVRAMALGSPRANPVITAAKSRRSLGVRRLSPKSSKTTL